MISALTRQSTIDGVSLAWDRWGGEDGTPFLMCHGFSGSTHDFALSIDDFAQRRPVVAIDHRGHGRSEKLGAVDRYSVDRLAADLIEFIDTQVGQPVDLLGHSMGGAISLRVTLARPDLVRSLILMDTSGWSFMPDDPAMASLMAGFLQAFDPLRGLPTLPPGPEAALIEAATPTEWQSMKAEMAAAFDPFAFKALGGELFTADGLSVRTRLGDIGVPVTVVVGEHDHPFVGQAEALSTEVPDGELHVIPGAYHSPQLTHQAEWVAAIEAHFTRA
jgi:pimeloyl-ACP methyl ester carboxylesterase